MKKKAFTLIELLVVISIIALLLAILMPALGKVKKQAQSTVCKSNLKQWGLAYSLYAADYNGRFMSTNWGQANESWMEVLRPYYEDQHKVRLCPSAKKISSGPTWPVGLSGATDKAWTLNATANTDEFTGGYGENLFVRHETKTTVLGSPAKYWGSPDHAGASEIPLVMDARWYSMAPRNDHATPTGGKLQLTAADWTKADIAVMRRHSKGINVVTADMSVNGLDAEELWNLRWNRQYDRKGRIDLPAIIGDNEIRD